MEHQFIREEHELAYESQDNNESKVPFSSAHPIPSPQSSDPLSIESTASDDPQRNVTGSNLFEKNSEEEDIFSSEPLVQKFTDSGLRSIEEIPLKFRHVFSSYPSFNAFQSRVIDDILYSDKSIVVSAPTGCGKTVIFELAIVNFLRRIMPSKYDGNFIIVYMAPIKALCAERWNDWNSKFSPLGLRCQEVTGDTASLPLMDISTCNIVITTPEKWDSLTRAWKDNGKMVQTVKLFLLDEIHLLNDERRGPVLEAVVSRMKTMQETISFTSHQHTDEHCDKLPFSIRFVAVSATIPNIEDVAMWLGTEKNPAAYFSVGEEYRPVRLKKVVLGYPFPGSSSQFQFELQLNYKLQRLLFQYSEGKPALIFCSTRKGVMQTCETLMKQVTFHFNQEQKENLIAAVNNIKENAVRKYLAAGVGCHHAGMDIKDRRIIEDIFRSGSLPVLVTTSTLAMGVNLPAHLVIIKSTQQYCNAGYQEYSLIQVLQMIGRAGRPQYDTHGTAIIMTHEDKVSKYTKLLDGTDILESNLHRHLAEHLNSEIVLNTITEKAVAINWIRSTFLYVRALQNPKFYGISQQLTKKGIEDKLQEMCMIEINALASADLVKMDIMDLWPTEYGRLMAHHYMSLESMRCFKKITGEESLSEMLNIVSNCHEYAENKLRVNEKRSLNTLNKSVRFPLKGLIKTIPMKVNCLIQAAFGALPVHEPSLQQESLQLMRTGHRIMKCLTRYLALKTKYQSLLSATILEKCFNSGLWENSVFISRQLEGIGPVLSQLLVSTGKTSFKAIAESNPRDLERIINRPPPMGNKLQKAALHMPQFHLKVENQVSKLSISVKLCNYSDIKTFSTPGINHGLVLLVGDSNNKLHLYYRFQERLLVNNNGSYTWVIEEPKASELFINLVSEEWVGLDVKTSLKLTKEEESPYFKPPAAYSIPAQTANTKIPWRKQTSTKKGSTKSTAKAQVSGTPNEKLPTILSHFREVSGSFLNAVGDKRLSKSRTRSSMQTNLDKFLFTPRVKRKLPTEVKADNERGTLTPTGSENNKKCTEHQFLKPKTPPEINCQPMSSDTSAKTETHELPSVNEGTHLPHEEISQVPEALEIKTTTNEHPKQVIPNSDPQRERPSNFFTTVKGKSKDEERQKTKRTKNASTLNTRTKKSTKVAVPLCRSTSLDVNYKSSVGQSKMHGFLNFIPNQQKANKESSSTTGNNVEEPQSKSSINVQSFDEPLSEKDKISTEKQPSTHGGQQDISASEAAAQMLNSPTEIETNSHLLNSERQVEERRAELKAHENDFNSPGGKTNKFIEQLCSLSQLTNHQKERDTQGDLMAEENAEQSLTKPNLFMSVLSSVNKKLKERMKETTQTFSNTAPVSNEHNTDALQRRPAVFITSDDDAYQLVSNYQPTSTLVSASSRVSQNCEELVQPHNITPDTRQKSTHSGKEKVELKNNKMEELINDTLIIEAQLSNENRNVSPHQKLPPQDFSEVKDAEITPSVPGSNSIGTTRTKFPSPDPGNKASTAFASANEGISKGTYFTEGTSTDTKQEGLNTSRISSLTKANCHPNFIKNVTKFQNISQCQESEGSYLASKDFSVSSPLPRKKIKTETTDNRKYQESKCSVFQQSAFDIGIDVLLDPELCSPPKASPHNKLPDEEIIFGRIKRKEVDFSNPVNRLLYGGTELPINRTQTAIDMPPEPQSPPTNLKENISQHNPSLRAKSSFLDSNNTQEIQHYVSKTQLHTDYNQQIKMERRVHHGDSFKNQPGFHSTPIPQNKNKSQRSIENLYTPNCLPWHQVEKLHECQPLVNKFENTDAIFSPRDSPSTFECTLDGMAFLRNATKQHDPLFTETGSREKVFGAKSHFFNSRRPGPLDAIFPL